MNARTLVLGQSGDLLQNCTGNFPCNGDATPRQLHFAFVAALVLFPSLSHAAAPTITKVMPDDDRRYVDVRIDSRMNEARLLKVARSVKAALPQFDGETTVFFRLPEQEEYTAWATVTVADGRKPLAIMNGFSPEELAGLVDAAKEQWLLVGDGTLYTITIDGNVPTMVIHKKDDGKITRQFTELRYIDGWIYDNTDHRYRFSDGTNAMHIQYWSTYALRGEWSGKQVAMRILTPKALKPQASHVNPLGNDIHEILRKKGYLVHDSDVNRSILVWKHRSTSATISGQFEGRGNGIGNRRTLTLEMVRDGNVLWKADRISIKQDILYINTGDGWQRADVER